MLPSMIPQYILKLMKKTLDGTLPYASAKKNPLGKNHQREKYNILSAELKTADM